MPISDLLAQISGDKASNSVGRPITTANNLKRKAGSNLHSNDPKMLHLTAPSPSRSHQADRSLPEKPSSTSTSGTGQRYTGMAGGRATTSSTLKTTAKPKPTPPSTSASSSRPPVPLGAPLKRGSFAEILARGKAAQATMGQVGKIQHKKVDGNLKHSKETAAPDTALRAGGGKSRGKKPAVATVASGYGGTSRPGHQRPAVSSGSLASIKRTAGQGLTPPPSASSSSSRKRPFISTAGRRDSLAPSSEPEKKIKKAATATTGYAGTARPRPGTEKKSSGKRHETARGGALLNIPTHFRSRCSRGKYDDEYDDDMNDFIDYDDEEEDEGDGRDRRRDYASDASSDMEAGMDDIYDEEDRASRIARQEDIREEKLEKSLKAAKEERRRKVKGL